MDQGSKDQSKLAHAEDSESNHSDTSREDPPAPPPVDNVQIVRDPPDGDS
jgi:hypothetical protein